MPGCEAILLSGQPDKASFPQIVRGEIVDSCRATVKIQRVIERNLGKPLKNKEKSNSITD